MNHFHYLMPCNLSNSFHEIAHSNLASIRLRSIPAIRAAKSLKWVVSFGEITLETPSIVLIGKFAPTRFSKELTGLIQLDSLKIAYAQSGRAQYLNLFESIRLLIEKKIINA